MKSIFKLTWRTIRTFFGRYMALLLIVALSAGFFAGLKITTDAMRNAGDKFFAAQAFYDFRVMSTLGFTDEDVAAFNDLDWVKTAEGSRNLDAIITFGEAQHPYKILSIPAYTNVPHLSGGRMPTSGGECLADDKSFSADDIGKKIIVDSQRLDNSEFIIVGIVDSPLYIGLDRGMTNIGSGTLNGFIYVPTENFKEDFFTDIFLTLNENAKIYSDEYNDIVERHESDVAALCDELASARFSAILEENQLTPELAEQFGIELPTTYVLTRNENAGYLSFENDTQILSEVANIFPVFFIMIAILVCITTMTRMVDEERTHIGILKAIGFSDGAIIMKYMLYAGSATLAGWALGFFLCTWALPKVFWAAYATIYDFSPIAYYFSRSLAVITLAVSLAGILLSTYLSCRRELRSVPANLIRPKTAKSGKRVALERLTPLWRRLSFLQKITARNMVRYKQRLIMMLVGISCCAGLLVTAFGIKDSMVDIGKQQFENIQTYELQVSFEPEARENVLSAVDAEPCVDGYIAVTTGYADLVGEKTLNSVNLICYAETEEIGKFWHFNSGDTALPLPPRGAILINKKAAEEIGASIGDSITVRDSNMNELAVTINGIFDNHIYNYVVMSDETWRDAFGSCNADTLLIKTDGSAEAAEAFTRVDGVTNVTQLSVLEGNVTEALSVLNYIIWLVVGFSGALAFIVIFNLTNINLAERRREIATVQVLGFYPIETQSYALRENLILSVIASILGLPLGTLFHMAVMSMVKINMFTFNLCIKPFSFAISFVCTVLFAVIVNCLMKRQIGKINMAESLKAVE